MGKIQIVIRLFTWKLSPRKYTAALEMSCGGLKNQIRQKIHWAGFWRQVSLLDVQDKTYATQEQGGVAKVNDQLNQLNGARQIKMEPGKVKWSQAK